ncbi:MAG: hypothetical protein K5989_04865 [Lachnospiraceae bacterium]|nr:hypothetical protein [Lachnospiraceae bacterium]
MLWFLFKVFTIGLDAAWGITKILFIGVLLPVILIVLVIVGFIYIALPILFILFVFSLLKKIF